MSNNHQKAACVFHKTTGADAAPFPPHWPLSLKHVLPDLTYFLCPSILFVSISSFRIHVPSPHLFSILSFSL